jgi:hypothetical protein
VFIAPCDLRYAKGLLLMEPSAMVALSCATGLANGLANDNISGIRDPGRRHLVQRHHAG